MEPQIGWGNQAFDKEARMGRVLNSITYLPLPTEPYTSQEVEVPRSEHIVKPSTRGA